jgi:hypothetical protein
MDRNPQESEHRSNRAPASEEAEEHDLSDDDGHEAPHEQDEPGQPPQGSRRDPPGQESQPETREDSDANQEPSPQGDGDPSPRRVAEG